MIVITHLKPNGLRWVLSCKQNYWSQLPEMIKPDHERIATLVAALALIEANPDHWNQTHWHCGTSHCLAGFCDIVVDRRLERLSLKEIRYDSSVSVFAQSNPHLGYLFTQFLTLEDLQCEIAYLVESGTIDGYDSNGYDEWGYDSDDYDIDGNRIEDCRDDDGEEDD